MLSERENLERVDLEDAAPFNDSVRDALIESCPRAIQRNPPIRRVSCLGLRLPREPVSTVWMPHYLTSLALGIEPSDGERGLDRIGAALQRKTNIKTLGLRYRYSLSEIGLHVPSCKAWFPVRRREH